MKPIHVKKDTPHRDVKKQIFVPVSTCVSVCVSGVCVRVCVCARNSSISVGFVVMEVLWGGYVPVYSSSCYLFEAGWLRRKPTALAA